MIKAQPIKDKNIYHSLIFHEINSLLDEILFKPVMAIAKGTDVQNAPTSKLITALRAGRITYAEGYFTGKFNSEIGLELRKIGATWNKMRKAYYLPQGNIPTDVKIAIAKGLSDIQSKIAKINEVLADLQKSNAIPKINFDPQFSAILIDVDQQYEYTMPKDIGLPMTLSAFQKEAIRREYVENLNKYIKDMTIASTERLREKIIENVQQGYRASNLVGVIEAEHGVASRHALFLAKQETSILVSTYRDARYQEAGVRRYLWSTSHDNRVRHDHKILDGKVFAFNEPPVTNQATQARNNPGYDYGCRCVAIPILDDDIKMKYGKNNPKKY